MKITDSAIEEIIGIFLNYFALFAFFAANRNNKGVVQLRCLGLKLEGESWEVQGAVSGSGSASAERRRRDGFSLTEVANSFT